MSDKTFAKIKLAAFFKSKLNIFMLVLIVLLTSALCVSSTYLYKRTKKVQAVSASYSKEQRRLDEAKKEIEEIKSQLEQEQKNNGDLKAQLEQKENEKKQLEEKVSGLQSEIEQLRAKKEQEQASVVPTPAPAVPPASKVCYLTFDDGPSDNTLRILDILARYNAKATFFVTCNGKPEYMKNIHTAGHTIGLHTASHNYAALYASTDAYFADLQQVSDMVKSQTGVESKIIRFPGGGSNLISKKYCPGIMSQLVVMTAERGYYYFDWNVSSEDAAASRVRADIIVNNVLTQAKNKNSICVLMHDEAAKTTTADALPAIIEGLTAMGYRFEALNETSYGYHHSVKN